MLARNPSTTSSVKDLVNSSPKDYIIDGGFKLQGTVLIQGAKNSALPIISAALLPRHGQTILRNVPAIRDVFVPLEILENLGATVFYDSKERLVVIDPVSLNRHELSEELTKKSRASVLFLPAVLSRLGIVRIAGVGGCALGPRRLDFHYNGFKRLGADVQGQEDCLTIKAERLQGNLVYLDIPSQTSTENLMMAACLASGITTIENAASEPEVVDFAKFLNAMGAKVSGAGTRTIIIEGVKELNAVDYTIMSDRLDAGPFMMAAGITGGDVTLIGAELSQMRIFATKLAQMGVEITSSGPVVRVKGPDKLHPINVVTWPYPGYSTDFLPGMMAMSCLASGKSYFRENVFEDRFTQVAGLCSMGATINKNTGAFAEVDGVSELHGADVVAPDLRAGMAFILAALAAHGRTTITNTYQIERGHSAVDTRLRELGAQITCSD
jgi:UDP-N-acetylglucosamine 1-carboxyvinyltransferase